MEKSWFAGNFCPVGSKCNFSDPPLKPVSGPIIREMVKEVKTEVPFLAEIRQFEEEPPQGEFEWMKAEGQLLDLEEYITLYPIIGYLYGDPASREVFPLPNLNDQLHSNYYICVKWGEEPSRS